MDIDLEFERIDARLVEYYTARERAVWWASPQPLLNGEIAMAVLNDGRHAELHRLLDKLDACVYL